MGRVLVSTVLDLIQHPQHSDHVVGINSAMQLNRDEFPEENFRGKSLFKLSSLQHQTANHLLLSKN